ncbi:loricrin-like [Penaeus monodon]|uniref:loricrin-like n=1 Tax=Penaeus monodon TaxID=6687 RepID=UPI0018A796D4|nr:loricrin-like [Penaeus monodon]
MIYVGGRGCGGGGSVGSCGGSGGSGSGGGSGGGGGSVGSGGSSGGSGGGGGGGGDTNYDWKILNVRRIVPITVAYGMPAITNPDLKHNPKIRIKYNPELIILV